jgi:tetratricopeptide (TPR) repeat protein
LHWLLGLTRLAAGDAAEALQEFDRELAVADIGRLYGREYAMHAHYGRGLAFLQTHRFEQAIGDLGRALELYPDHAQTHLSLALAHRALGSRERARLEFARVDAILAILTGSKPIDAAMIRAMYAAADDRIDEAAATLEHLLAGVPAGFAGWTIPIEPLLGKLHGHQSFAVILRSLADRAR